MSIPTGGGAGGLAKSAGAGASNAGVGKAGSSAAKSATDSTAPAIGGAANSSGKGMANNSFAQKAGFGSGSSGSGAGLSPAAKAMTDSPLAKTLAQSPGGGNLGAGGTAAAGSPEAHDGAVGKAGGGLGKSAAAAAAVPAVGAGVQMMFALMVLNWLKTMFFAAAAAIANLVNMIIGVALTVAKALFGGAMAVGTAISSFVGGAVSAGASAAAAAVSFLTVVAVTVTAVVTGVGGNDTAKQDGALHDCSADVVAASASSDVPDPGDSGESTLNNAKVIFSVLSAWGMSDENVAGILGNWDAESGIDPTGVETIMGEPFKVGTRKQAAETAGFDVTRVAPAYGATYPGVKLLGIGLGQWSNGRNTQLLEYAGGTGKWATLETQLGFMISKDSGAPVIKHMISSPLGSPSAAAIYFHDEWERSADASTMTRETAARKWFAQMGGWEKNQSLADSILAQSGSTLDDANAVRVNTAKANCLTNSAAGVTAGLKDGGLSLEEAEALMATYKSEGDAVLAEAFGGGGPGDCGFGKADNCVGFSSYFVWKFTSFKQYASGNGIRTAASMAEMMGKETSRTPTPYSVFSMETSAPEGHTGVILGIDGDTAIVGEASCGSNHAGTRAFTIPVSELTGGGYTFTDVSDLLTDEAKA